VAIIFGHVQAAVADMLLEHGSDVEATCKAGWTALYFACSKGHLAGVKKLLAHGAVIQSNENNCTATILGKCKSRGADIEAKEDLYGHFPLHVTSHRDNLPVVKALLRQWWRGHSRSQQE
jgi:hypothetical protein